MTAVDRRSAAPAPGRALPAPARRVREARPVPKRAMSAVLALLVLAAAPAPYAASSGVLLTLSIAAALVSTTDRDRRYPTIGAVLPFLMVGLAFSSAVWSEVPIATLTGSAELGLLTLAALTAAQVLSIGEIVSAVATGLRSVLLLSVAVGVAMPGVGLVGSAYGFGALKGVFLHRNALAFVAVLALVAVFLTRGLRSRRAVVLDVCLAFGCVLAAQSQSSLVVAIALGVLWAAVGFARSLEGGARALVLGTAGVLITAGIVVGLGALPELTQGLGRDTTFTGRTDIWAAVLDEVPRHPYFGAGWKAVWLPGLPITYRMWTAITFPVYTAHNGYLDFLLQLGVASLVVLAGVLLVPLTKGLALALRRSEPWAMWPFLVTAALIVADVTESQFTSEIGWLIICLAASCLCVRTPVTATPLPPQWRSSIPQRAGARP